MIAVMNNTHITKYTIPCVLSIKCIKYRVTMETTCIASHFSNMGVQADRRDDRQTGGMTGRQAGWQAGRQAGWQANRQDGRQTVGVVAAGSWKRASSWAERS